jgi:hypothetical protein
VADASDCVRARELQAEVVDLLDLGRLDEAIRVADELLQLFAQQEDGPALPEIGDAMVGTASALAFNRPYGRSATEDVLSRMAVLGRGLVTGGRAKPAPGDPRCLRTAQALRMDDAVIARLGESPDPKLHAIAVESRINRAGSLALVGDVKRSFAQLSNLLSGPDSAFDQIAARAKDGERKTVEERVAVALRRGNATGNRRE